MTFEEADILCDMIVAFMVSMGGPYEKVTGCLEAEIMWALGAGQYVLKMDDNWKILYFASVWFVREEDLEGVVSSDSQDRMKPSDCISGETVYVAEAAAVSGKGMDMVKAIRRLCAGKTGVHWHRPARGKVISFTKQQGA